MGPRKLQHDAYTVGWVCVLDCELNAARALLDEEDEELEPALHDDNIYLLGRIGKHNVVITFTGAGAYGTTPAAQAVTNLVRTFPNIRFGLMVGVGGAVPSAPHPNLASKDIRLGDVVVSEPKGHHGGVLNYDMGKWKDENKLSIQSHLNSPPGILRQAVEKLRADQRFCKGKMTQYRKEALDLLSTLPDMDDPTFPGWEKDRLFNANYIHVDEKMDCSGCDLAETVHRVPRPTQDPVVHYGLIASGNAVMRNAALRDRLRDEWNVICFEMEAAGLINHFPCLVIRGLCDYSDSHKAKGWQAYAAVVAASYAKDLLRVIGSEQLKHTEIATHFMEEVFSTLTEVDRGVQKIKETVDDTYKHKVLDWLSPFDHETEQSDFFAQRQKDTGNWFLESTEFQYWCREPNKNLLCQGIPGAGKTTITSIIVHHLHTMFPQSSNIGIAYLYCNFRRQDSDSLDRFFSILLKQLSQLQSQLPACVTEAYEIFWSQHIFPSPEKLLQMLGTVIASYRRVYIIVDALDEIDASDGTCRRFLSSLFKLQESTPISFIATSRPVADIASMFRRNKSNLMEIRALDDDVRRYIDGQMDKLRPFISEEPEMRSRVKETIVQAVDGMFLLAKLHMDSLRDKVTKAEVKQALKSLPTGSNAYDQIYRESMARIQAQTDSLRGLAMRVLGWIVCAARTLTTFELQHAVALMGNMKVLDEDDLPEIDLVIEVCFGLVKVDEKSSIIRLVHFTAQEYFQRNWTFWFPTGHSDIATTCCIYLSQEHFGKEGNDKPNNSSRPPTKWPLSGYSARFWLHHARFQPLNSQLLVECLSDKLRVSNLDRNITPSCLCDVACFPPPNRATGLHMAAYFGSVEAVKQLVGNGISFDVQDRHGRTALSWTAEHADRSHSEVAQVLLEMGANPNHRDDHSATPLLWGAGLGNVSLVKLLLQAGAKADTEDNSSLLPIERAVHDNHHAVVTALLDHDPDLYSEDAVDSSTWKEITIWRKESGLHKTPTGSSTHDLERPRRIIAMASREGFTSEVERLLDTGVDPDFRDQASGRSPISLAAEYGHLNIVSLFLDRGVNPDMLEIGGDNTNKTPLMWAAMYGHEETARILIQHGANPVSKERYGPTPLSWAAENGHEGMIKLLLEQKGVDINYQGEHGKTALHWASWNGHRHVVERLLRNGADQNIVDFDNRTPLSFAAERGHDLVVELLLEQEAVDINSQGAIGKTALHWASRNGHRHVVEQLLHSGANSAICDTDNRTPLSMAAEHGRESIVKLLLEQSAASVNVQGSAGKTALIWASWFGHRHVVERLLRGGADHTLEDGDNKTALDYARDQGYTFVVETLQAHGGSNTSPI